MKTAVTIHVMLQVLQALSVLLTFSGGSSPDYSEFYGNMLLALGWAVLGVALLVSSVVLFWRWRLVWPAATFVGINALLSFVALLA